MSRFFRGFKSRPASRQGGQIAIFIALIFQVLFLFFAMVVNVGLLVHHKINLQNSVDLAAYYGAMKQAEVMNAIAHTNYQIRQSYKLLTWRYRVLGTAGVIPDQGAVRLPGGHPAKKVKPGVDTGTNGAVIAYSDEDGYPTSDPKLKDYYERPSFCVAFKPFKEVPPNENLCREPSGQTIAGLKVPPVIAGFIGAASTAQQVTIMANRSKDERCKFAGPFNYALLGKFIVAFNIDQGDRKSLIYKMGNNLGQSTTDFVDIEGEKASEGLRKTLDNNLTAANKAAVKDFKIFNSLASGPCGEGKGSTQGVPGWLAEVAIYPRSSYKMCWSDSGSNSQFDFVNIDTMPSESKSPGGVQDTSNGSGELPGLIQYLHNFIAPNSEPMRPSLGVEKNPWCMAYVGVRAETEPDIPFSLGSIRLKAYAFAKPFGGRIGPWYGKNWQPGIKESTGSGEDQRTDPRTPNRCPFGDLGQCTVQGQDESTTLNYSRFPGDPVGLRSRAIHGQYTKSIFDSGEITFNGWSGIEVPANGRGGEWDILSYGGGPEKKIRNLEIAAVVPDIFDMTYYSIEPDFYNDYFVGRLDKYLKNNPISTGTGGYVYHHDIGSRLSGDAVSGRPSISFSVKDQLATAAQLAGSSNNSYSIDWSGKLKYALVGDGNFAEVLTGWISKKDLSTYDMDTERFGKCTVVAGANAHVPSNCEKGGRTGYSVKLISSDYLMSTHKLGGNGSASAKILNPPLDDFIK